MKKIILLITFIFSVSSITFGQTDFQNINVNELFQLDIDSFEIRNTNSEGRIDTKYFLHYTMTNISDSTIFFATNDCPSYNQYIFEINDIVYFPNRLIHCYVRGGKTFYLASNQSFSEVEIMYDDFSNIKPGETYLKLSLPLDVRSSVKIGIDGLRKSDTIQKLIFEGQILIVENTISD